ncbi:MAG TPA: hypothetical protein P5567_12520 [Kiritimatiellia bacterium]|nr:hypothetical protein [Kiritimatiellia bacterium]HRZ13265.1 hypothetical protein [Kiritimatiellia bacterium]HSA18714.1 hypothetical protein [Kiritimatiellia bacterium]
MPSRLSSRLGLAVLAAAVALYGALAWHHRDVSRISRRLDRLRKLFNKEAGESPLTALRRAHEMAGAFTASPEIRLGPYLPDLFSRQELVVAVHRARLLLEEIEVTIRDKLITVSDDRQSATTDLAAEGVYLYRGEQSRDITEIRLTWVKENGEWLIRSAVPLETIQPPGKVRRMIQRGLANP